MHLNRIDLSMYLILLNPKIICCYECIIPTLSNDNFFMVKSNIYLMILEKRTSVAKDIPQYITLGLRKLVDPMLLSL